MISPESSLFLTAGALLPSSNGTSPVVDEIDAGVHEIMAAVLVNGADLESPISFAGELTGETPDKKFPLVPTAISSNSSSLTRLLADTP